MLKLEQSEENVEQQADSLLTENLLVKLDELDRSLKKLKGLSPYSEARHEYKSDVKHKCELCRRSVLKDIDFLCSDECANKYWKVKKKREI